MLWSNCFKHTELTLDDCMIALIQRVKHAQVEVSGELVGSIGPGLLAFIAVEPSDTPLRIERMAERLLGYRVFNDTDGKMNLSVQTVSGGLLLVSQFTLAADTNTGMRPSFASAAQPEKAIDGFNALVEAVKRRHGDVATGRFGADMQVGLLNDGPVTFLLST